MRSVRRHLALVATAALLAAQGIVAAAESGATGVNATKAREQWAAGYLKVEAADRSETEKQLTLALSLYKEALEAFQTVAAQYPDWNRQLVEYRLTYCTDKIRQLETTLAVEADKRDKPALIESVVNLEKRVKGLQTQLDETQAALAAERARSAGLQETLEAAKANLVTLQKDLDTARKDAADRAAALDRVQGKLANVDSLERENKKALADLKDLQAQIEAATKNRDKTESDLKKAQADLTGLKNDKTALEADLTKARSDLDGATKQIGALREEVAAKTKEIDSLKVASAKVDTLTKELKDAKANATKLADDLAAKTESERRLLAEQAERVAQEKRQAEAEKSRTRDVAAALGAAATALKNKQADAAAADYRKALELDPGNAAALQQLGKILADQGKHADAEGCLLKALAQKPDDVQSLTTLGYVFLRQDKTLEAVGALSRAVAVGGKNAESRRVLGVACGALGWFKAAESQFLESYRLDAKSGETAYNLALLYATLDEPQMKDAREWYNKARQLGAQADANLEKFLSFGK